MQHHFEFKAYCVSHVETGGGIDGICQVQPDSLAHMQGVRIILSSMCMNVIYFGTLSTFYRYRYRKICQPTPG